VTGAKLGLFSVSSTRISPGAVSESKLNTNAVDPEALAAINERRVSANADRNVFVNAYCLDE
jgi:hypothetical protein